MSGADDDGRVLLRCRKCGCAPRGDLTGGLCVPCQGPQPEAPPARPLTARRARTEHAEHLAGLIAAGGPVGALAAYLRDADLPRAAGALLRRHATRIEAPQ